MQSQAELKVIVPEQSVWAQVMGWLPVVVIAGALIFVVNLIQSTMGSSATKPAAKVVTAEAVEISYWPLWILALVVIIVSAVVMKYRDTLKEKSWWKDKNDDSKKLFWYIVVILVAYAASGIAPEGAAIAFKGIAALVAVHFVWTLSPGKPHVLTWIIVGGMILYFVLAWLVPPVVDIRNAGVEVIQLKAKQGSHYANEYADNLRKCVNKEPGCVETTGEASATSNNDARLVTQESVVSVRPGEPFRVAEIPSGAKTIRTDWKCDQGCVLEIEHDGDLLCKNWNGTEGDNGRTWHTGFYQELSCRITIVETSKNRYREQFLLPAGPGKVEFPKNLVNVISSVGTIEEMGTIDATATTVASR